MLSINMVFRSFGSIINGLMMKSTRPNTCRKPLTGLFTRWVQQEPERNTARKICGGLKHRDESSTKWELPGWAMIPKNQCSTNGARLMIVKMCLLWMGQTRYNNPTKTLPGPSWLYLCEPLSISWKKVKNKTFDQS